MDMPAFISHVFRADTDERMTLPVRLDLLQFVFTTADLDGASLRNLLQTDGCAVIPNEHGDLFPITALHSSKANTVEEMVGERLLFPHPELTSNRACERSMISAGLKKSADFDTILRVCQHLHHTNDGTTLAVRQQQQQEEEEEEEGQGEAEPFDNTEASLLDAHASDRDVESQFPCQMKLFGELERNMPQFIRQAEEAGRIDEFKAALQSCRIVPVIAHSPLPGMRWRGHTLLHSGGTASDGAGHSAADSATSSDQHHQRMQGHVRTCQAAQDCCARDDAWVFGGVRFVCALEAGPAVQKVFGWDTLSEHVAAPDVATQLDGLRDFTASFPWQCLRTAQAGSSRSESHSSTATTTAATSSSTSTNADADGDGRAGNGPAAVDAEEDTDKVQQLISTLPAESRGELDTFVLACVGAACVQLYHGLALQESRDAATSPASMPVWCGAGFVSASRVHAGSDRIEAKPFLFSLFDISNALKGNVQQLRRMPRRKRALCTPNVQRANEALAVSRHESLATLFGFAQTATPDVCQAGLLAMQLATRDPQNPANAPIRLFTARSMDQQRTASAARAPDAELRANGELSPTMRAHAMALVETAVRAVRAARRGDGDSGSGSDSEADQGTRGVPAVSNLPGTFLCLTSANTLEERDRLVFQPLEEATGEHNTLDASVASRTSFTSSSSSTTTTTSSGLSGAVGGGIAFLHPGLVQFNDVLEVMSLRDFVQTVSGQTVVEQALVTAVGEETQEALIPTALTSLLDMADALGEEEVEVVFDETQYPSNRVLGESFKSLQGPALVVRLSRAIGQREFESLLKPHTRETANMNLFRYPAQTPCLSNVFLLSRSVAVLSGPQLHVLEHSSSRTRRVTIQHFNFGVNGQIVPHLPDQFVPFERFGFSMTDTGLYDGTIIRIPLHGASEQMPYWLHHLRQQASSLLCRSVFMVAITCRTIAAREQENAGEEVEEEEVGVSARVGELLFRARVHPCEAAMKQQRLEFRKAKVADIRPEGSRGFAFFSGSSSSSSSSSNKSGSREAVGAGSVTFGVTVEVLARAGDGSASEEDLQRSVQRWAVREASLVGWRQGQQALMEALGRGDPMPVLGVAVTVDGGGACWEQCTRSIQGYSGLLINKRLCTFSIPMPAVFFGAHLAEALSDVQVVEDSMQFGPDPASLLFESGVATYQELLLHLAPKVDQDTYHPDQFYAAWPRLEAAGSEEHTGADAAQIRVTNTACERHIEEMLKDLAKKEVFFKPSGQLCKLKDGLIVTRPTGPLLAAFIEAEFANSLRLPRDLAEQLRPFVPCELRFLCACVRACVRVGVGVWVYSFARE